MGEAAGGGSDGGGGMEERVVLTPVLGAHREGPLSYLLEVDQTRILLDCGWNEAFDPAEIEPLRKVLPTVDLILISFGDLEHIGALPYAIREFGIKDNCTVYLTTPTKELGLRALYDAYLSRARLGDFDVFDLEDVDAVEERMKERPFGSQITVTGKSVNEIVIDAIGAGRLLGGCMWRITREPDKILYAVDFSTGKDSLLEGINRKCDAINPTLLITDSFNFLAVRNNLNRRQREEDLCRKVLDALRRGVRRQVNVLMPVDAAGRVLELLYILSNFFRQHNLTYPIIWVTSVASLLDAARDNMVEYMNDEIRRMAASRKDPFLFNNVQIVSSAEQVLAIREPKIILASSGGMEAGPIRELIQRFGPYEGNMIMLTDKTMMPGSLTRSLKRHLDERRTDFMVRANLTIEMEVSQWVYKTGQELVLWRMQRKERQQAEARRRQQEEERRALSGDIAMDGMDVYAIMGQEDAQELPEAKEEVANTFDDRAGAAPGLQRQQSGMGLEDAAKTGGGLFSVFAQRANTNQTMFSAYEPERTKRWDEYGEIINEDEFVKEEREDAANDMHPEDESESDMSEDEDDEVANAAAAAAAAPDGGDAMDIDRPRRSRRRAKNYGNPLEDALLRRDKRNALPRECEKRMVKVPLLCSLAYVDMESRASNVDSKTIINILKPRKVLIVHGSTEATRAMVESCRKSAIQTVLAPQLGETADVSSDVGMWRMELDRGLFDQTYPLFSQPKMIALKKREAVGIRYVEGVVDENEAQLHVVRPLEPALDETLARTVEPKFIHGNVNRGDILRRLQEHDEQEDLAAKDRINARLHLGVIVCNNSVSVTVEDGGERLQVEGPACRTFFNVRRVVYGSYERV